MRTILLLFTSFILLLACSSPEPKEQVISHPVATVDTLPKKLAKDFGGIEDLKRFKATYEQNWPEKPTQFPYSDYASIKVFALDCYGPCRQAVFQNRTAREVVITATDFSELMDVLSAPKTYGDYPAACFEPKIGVVLYDVNNIPTEYLSICLTCNNLRTYPGKIPVKLSDAFKTGFSKKARKELRSLFFKWGFDYYGYSPLVDDESAYENYLNQERDTTKIHIQ